MLETLTIDSRIKRMETKDLIIVPKVIRVNGFCEESVKSFSTGMSMAHQTGQPVIPVVIDSVGGDPYALFAMVDIIDSASLPVATIIEGKAFSSGAALFCCGTEGYRFMGPNATLMIHDVLSGDEEFKKAGEVMVDALETNRISKRMYRLIDKHIGKPAGYTPGVIAQRSRTDWYLNAKQAMKHGYANHIRVPTMRCDVKVEMELTW